MVQDTVPSDESSMNVLVAPKRRKISMTIDAQKLTQEELAAETLMALHRADRTMGERMRAMSRRVTS